MSIDRMVLPAKAMLFGEYGVLEGYPAVAATLPMFRFVVDFEFKKNGAERASLEVASDHLSGGRLGFAWSAAHPFSPRDGSRDERFFRGLVAPFAASMLGCSLTAVVRESFSPSWGFGSSSALLAAFHLALWRRLGETPIPVRDAGFWSRVHASLALIQGRGSGYDVGVQVEAWCRRSAEVQVWGFFPGTVPEVRPVEVDALSRFGCLLPTGIYADTAAAVKRHAGSSWGEEHGKIALEFLSEPSASRLPAWMARSRRIAFEQGLLGENEGPMLRFSEALSAFPWKTMGAGHGDCLWVGASREALAEAVHPQTGLPLSKSILFSFSDKGRSNGNPG